MKFIISIVTIVFMGGCYSKAIPEKTGQEGNLLPSFNVQLIDSTTYINTGNIETGKPVALFYFSPECPHCRSQMEEIIEDMDRLKSIQFYLLTSYSVSDMKHFSSEYRLSSYPNIIVGKDTANFLLKYFAMPGVPYMAIYGKDKKLHKAFVGKIYSQQLKSVAEEE